MPRPSLLSLKRARMPEWTLKDLSDPAQPDLEPFDWTLRRLDPLAESTVKAAADAFFEQYERAGGFQPLLSGDMVEVTEGSALTAASIQAMQVRVNEDDAPFSIEEVHSMMATCPDAWQRVEVVGLVLAKGELPEQARRRVEAEGPEFVALAERHGCFAPPVEDDEGNASRGTAPPASP